MLDQVMAAMPCMTGGVSNMGRLAPIPHRSKRHPKVQLMHPSSPAGAMDCARLLPNANAGAFFVTPAHRKRLCSFWSVPSFGQMPIHEHLTKSVLPTQADPQAYLSDLCELPPRTHDAKHTKMMQNIQNRDGNWQIRDVFLADPGIPASI